MSIVPGLAPADLALLARYDTPTICNVIELFRHRPQNVGYMDDRIRARFPQMPPMVGYAATATYRTVAPSPAPCSVADLIESFADLPGPPIVVFQDLDEPTTAASFGDVMCSTFQAFGSVGLVSSGAGRDLDQVEALNFPVFTGAIICAHGYCHIPSVGGPVHVGGVMVHPGDLLHGDRNGVTTIPNEIASEVAQAAEDFVAMEKVILDYVQTTSAPTVAGDRAAVAEAEALLAALCRRLRPGGGAKRDKA